VLHSSHRGGFWAFSQFADVTGAANDHVHYTTREGVTVPPLGLPTGSVPLTTDPPEHKFYRRALQPFFTPTAVAELEGPIRAVVIERIESFAADGHADLVAELAGPVPCIVIAMILGLGQCNSLLPALFEIDDDGTARVLAPEVPPELLREAATVADRCPTGAISPGITHRRAGAHLPGVHPARRDPRRRPPSRPATRRHLAGTGPPPTPPPAPAAGQGESLAVTARNTQAHDTPSKTYELVH
jgi:cytochrome P450